MLKYNDPNPLAVFGLRELDHCPPHFSQVTFDLKSNPKIISDWIWANLSGRFWYGDYYYKNEDSSVHYQKRVAFELASEASMFALMLDTINRFDFEF